MRVVRGPYTEEKLKYSAQSRCLVNHANAWRLAKESQGPVLVVEADFVPVVGFGDLPMLWDVTEQEGACGWVYSGAPIFYYFDENGYVRGHSATMVANVFTPGAAEALLGFAEEELANTAVKGDYSPWDVRLGTWLRYKRGIPNYLSFRQYREHGGIPNPEHKKNRIVSWHQADVLQGRLSFMPLYAKNGKLRYLVFRARARGLYRLLSGKMVYIYTMKVYQGKW